MIAQRTRQDARAVRPGENSGPNYRPCRRSEPGAACSAPELPEECTTDGALRIVGEEGALETLGALTRVIVGAL